MATPNIDNLKIFGSDGNSEINFVNFEEVMDDVILKIASYLSDRDFNSFTGTSCRIDKLLENTLYWKNLCQWSDISFIGNVGCVPTFRSTFFAAVKACNIKVILHFALQIFEKNSIKAYNLLTQFPATEACITLDKIRSTPLQDSRVRLQIELAIACLCIDAYANKTPIDITTPDDLTLYNLLKDISQSPDSTSEEKVRADLYRAMLCSIKSSTALPLEEDRTYTRLLEISNNEKAPLWIRARADLYRVNLHEQWLIFELSRGELHKILKTIGDNAEAHPKDRHQANSLRLQFLAEEAQVQGIATWESDLDEVLINLQNDPTTSPLNADLISILSKFK